MENTDLTAGSQARLNELLAAIAEVLQAQEDSPHLRAFSASHFNRNNPLVFNDGGIVAPGKPQFDYEERPIALLHRTFLKSAPEVYRVMIHGARADESSPWKLTPKLISLKEQEALEAAIQPLSAQIESELRAIEYTGELDYLNFGRWNKPAQIGLSIEGKAYQRLQPSPKLLDLLRRVDEIYEAAGLRLVNGDWTLRPDGFEYAEYYE